MNITELLIPDYLIEQDSKPIHDQDLMNLWKDVLLKSGYQMKLSNKRSDSLTDMLLFDSNGFQIPVHMKVIGRHMNGSFRCHIGTSKASRPIQSIELVHQMRLLVVFFRAESTKKKKNHSLVSPEFIFFPTWLLHLFRYTQYESIPGRTDVRFLENEHMAKEDHIYRLNHVINTLFRFNLYQFDAFKLKSAIELANFLFDSAGLDYRNLPKPLVMPNEQPFNTQPIMYFSLLLLLHSPRPTKFKPMCFNCNSKPASRRRLCVACYRYQLKHGGPRPLRLIVANRPGPRYQQPAPDNLPMVFYSPKKTNCMRSQKSCANCQVKETHQWYRNLCGQGNWCETCKSYYLRHKKIRPPELFVKAAKRKVDVRTLVNWNTWSWNDIPMEIIENATHAITNHSYYDLQFDPQQRRNSCISSTTTLASPNSLW